MPCSYVEVIRRALITTGVFKAKELCNTLFLKVIVVRAAPSNVMLSMVKYAYSSLLKMLEAVQLAALFMYLLKIK